MQILSEQRLNEIMSVFKFFGSIANDHRLPLPNQQTGEDSYSSNLYSTFSHTPPACTRFISSFRFFSERFSALLILLLRGTAKNEGIPERLHGNCEIAVQALPGRRSERTGASCWSGAHRHNVDF